MQLTSSGALDDPALELQTSDSGVCMVGEVKVAALNVGPFGCRLGGGGSGLGVAALKNAIAP